MMKTLMTAMMASTSEVMETMFFLPVEFREELTTLIQSGMGKQKSNMACRIKFSGDVSGSLTLLIPKDLLAQMTENFMGEPLENLQDKHLSGTLTEILNIICGNALRKVKANNPFELDIPEMIDELNIPETKLFTIIETPGSMMAINISVD